MPAQKLLKKILYSLIFIIILSYSIFKVYGLFAGPLIEIYYPTNGEKVDSVFTVTGKISRADKIYLFDREVWTNEDGYFKENMIATENYTDIIMHATNRWGKESQIKITVENILNKN